MKKAFKMIILILCISLVLTECVIDYHSNHEYYFNNSSDYIFCIKIKTSLTPEVVKYVEPHTSVLIDDRGVQDVLRDYGDNFLRKFFNDLSIGCNDSLFVNKDIMKRNNWEYVKDEKTQTNTYTFTIYNSDTKRYY